MGRTDAADANRRSPETLRLRGVSPGLTVGDVKKSLAWYRDVLGFHVEEEYREKGELTGAAFVAGSVRLWIGQDDWKKGRDRKKGEGFRLHLVTAQDVDELAAAIESRGGTLESQPADMPWGGRAFQITDPDGFKLSIASK